MAGRHGKQGRWWIGTIPAHHFTPFLPKDCEYIRGQLESGDGTGYLHWQIVFYTRKKLRLGGVRSMLGPYHYELTKSSCALEYVWKDATAIPSTRFELGRCPMRRNDGKDWKVIYEHAKRGELDNIPEDVVIRYYGNLQRIMCDNLRPVAHVKRVELYWGPTGTGKSRLAWWTCGPDGYPKDPKSKFFDGYRGQNSVIVDEYRGAIDPAHILRWTDQYPCIIEVKGSSRPLLATTIIFTSNLPMEKWYPELDAETFRALVRRFTKVINFNINAPTWDSNGNPVFN